MIKPGIYLLILAAAAVGGFILLSLDGTVTFPLGDQQAEVPVGFAILGIAVLGILFALLWTVLFRIVSLPSWITDKRRSVRRRKANDALTDALLAAEAGDARAAEKLSRKAERHADDDRLQRLLDAKVAAVGDDWSGAEAAWRELSRLPGGELAGLRGAAQSAVERGDTKEAEALAARALDLKTGARWPFEMLFDLRVARGDWTAALDALAAGAKQGLADKDVAARRTAVLKTARGAGRLQADGAAGADAQRDLSEGMRAAPDFVPAAYLGARSLMAAGKPGDAMRVVESGWRARPHPALSRLARRILKDAGDTETARRLQQLAELNPAARESRILSAEADMQRGDWDDAIDKLALLVEEEPTSRLCQLVERALSASGREMEAANWARMASTAAREADWSDLDSKGHAFAYSGDEWREAVYSFGDRGELIHPGLAAPAREMEAALGIALPAPRLQGPGGGGEPVQTLHAEDAPAPASRQIADASDDADEGGADEKDEDAPKPAKALPAPPKDYAE